MLYQHNDLLFKYVARETAEQYRREAENERLARELQTPAPPKRAPRKRVNFFVALRRRLHHPASV